MEGEPGLSGETERLLEALDRHREAIHALPGVVGSGVGLREGRPVVEIYVEGSGEDVEQALRGIADLEFVLVPWSKPTEAQAPRADREE